METALEQRTWNLVYGGWFDKIEYKGRKEYYHPDELWSGAE